LPSAYWSQKLRSAALLIVVSALTGHARAQVPPAGSEPATLPVYQMTRPFYDPAGVKAGSFLLFPKASEAIGYDDNIFASGQHATADAISTTNEALSLASQWAQHSLSANVFATQEVFARHGSNNGDVWSAQASGRIDITTNALFQLDAGFIQQPLARGIAEAGEVPKRPIFNTTDISANYTQHDGRLANRLEFSFRDVAYISDVDASRSGTRYSYRDRLSYDLSSSVSPFAEVVLVQQDWLRRSELRDFDLLTGIFGASFEIPSILQAEFGAGVLRQSYRNAAFDTLVAPTAHEQLIWNVRPLTSIIATVDRTIIGTETFCDARVSSCLSAAGSVLPGDPNVPARRNSLQITTAELGVQHEFWHDVLGEARFRYERDFFDFNGLTDRIFLLRANLRYLINHLLEADLDYTYRERTANLPADRTFNSGPYSENVVSMTLKAGL
jgi:hypothetical protein